MQLTAAEQQARKVMNMAKRSRDGRPEKLDDSNGEKNKERESRSTLMQLNVALYRINYRVFLFFRYDCELM